MMAKKNGKNNRIQADHRYEFESMQTKRRIETYDVAITYWSSTKASFMHKPTGKQT